MQNGDFKRGSIRELIAWLVWSKEKTVFAKNTMAILLSNMGSDKCFDKFKEMQEEIFPVLKKIRDEEAKKAAVQLQKHLKEEIRFNA